MDEIAKAQQNEVSAKIDLKLLQSFRLETVNYFVILYAFTDQRGVIDVRHVCAEVSVPKITGTEVRLPGKRAETTVTTRFQ